jgi:hypothetical protein
MLREIVLSVGLVVLGVGAAWAACPGQTGKVIFNDDFADDSGGWDTDAHQSFVPGAAQLKADSKAKGVVSLNQTFNAVNADYCAVFAYPAAPPEAGDADVAVLIVLAADYRNRYQMTVSSEGTAVIYHLQGGDNWQILMPATKVASVKTDPGAENTLRIVVKDQKLTFFVNGAQVKVIRAQTPDANSKFGFFAGTTSSFPSKERVYLVKSFSVTEAP